MSRFSIVFLLLLAVLGLTALLTDMKKANAFSSQPATNVLGGNASNFADPDEQMPAFVNGPDAQSQTVRPMPSVSIDQNADRERAMGLSQAFDQSYLQK